MGTPIITTEGLSFSYNGSDNAISDVSLKVGSGERIAVIGSNGAGKSTFFLCLNGILTPQHGAVYYKGEKITKRSLNELRRNVGIVFQDADSQIIASTVRAEISFGPMNLRLPRDEVALRVDEAMRFMNLEGFGDRPPHYLSGGEKKRVSIADIIAMKPELIIFDEPTASLDPANAAMLEDVLRRLSDEGKALIVSTHDMDFAYRWASRVIVFSGGSVIADGDPLDIFKDEAFIKSANLCRPMLLEAFEALIASGLINSTNTYPRSVKELKAIL